jgi:hypothetical protein
MVTRGGKSIIEVLGAMAKYSEDLQEYMVLCWNIVAATINSITLSSLQKKPEDEENAS